MVWGDGEEMKGKRRKRNSESDLFKGARPCGENSDPG